MALITLLGACVGAKAQVAAYQGQPIGGGFSLPSGVAVDGSGNVYVTDSSLRRVDEVPAGCTSASCVVSLGGGFASPQAVAVDGSGNIYVADGNRSVIYKMANTCTSSTCVTSLGGGFGQPLGVAVDGAGNVYVADFGIPSINAGVYKMAGTCVSSACVTSLGGGFFGPSGVAVDGGGNVYVADYSHNVLSRMANTCTSSACMTTLGGGFARPRRVAVDGNGTIYVGDSGSGAVKELSGTCTSSSCVVTLGGGFSDPLGVAVDGSGNLYVADQVVRKLVLSGTAFAGTALGSSSTQTLTFTIYRGGNLGAPQVVTQGATGLDFTDAGTGTCTTNGTSHSYAVNETCTVDVKFAPLSPGIRYGAVKLTTTGGAVITTAYLYGTGNGPQAAFNPGIAHSSFLGGFRNPEGLAIDAAGNIYVTDTDNNLVKMYFAATSYATNVVLGGGFNAPLGLAVDGAGNVYVADFRNNAVKRMTNVCTSSACVTTLGGGFSHATGVAVDGSGTVYVATGVPLSPIYKLSNTCTSSSCVTSLGGNTFFAPIGVAVDGAGNVYVANSGANEIDEMPNTCMSSSCVTSRAGGAFINPSDVAVDGGGNIYVTNFDSGLVREMPAGCLSASCVTTLSGGSDSLGAIAVDGSGNVYVTDTTANIVTKVDRASGPTLPFATSTVVGSLDTTDGTRTVTLQDIGNAGLAFSLPGMGVNPSFPNGFLYNNSSTCSQLSTSSLLPFLLAAGASCTVGIDFQPAAVGSNSGNVVLKDNSLNVTNAMQNIGVSGTGITPPLPVPTVIAVSPALGLVTGGTSVTITGTGFFGGASSNAVTAVKFGSTAAASYTVNSDTSITASSPAGTGTVDVTVTTSGGTTATATADQFTYQNVPTVKLSGAWTQLSPANSPAGRAESSMVYDQATGNTLLFGGVQSSGFLNDTWTWDGSTWTKLAPASSPSSREGASMVYDAATNNVVLFGGLGSSSSVSETWTWDGTTWTQLSPAASPSARSQASMVYDTATGQVILFGGFTASGGTLGDTWNWNGTTWTQLAPASSPAARSGASMAYDAATGNVILFGGRNAADNTINDTWIWDGSNWTQATPVTSPPSRSASSLTYDPVMGGAVLFGGVATSSLISTLNDTWFWDGTNWTQLATSGSSPSTRLQMNVTYEPAAGGLLLFGGSHTAVALNDTWRFNSNQNFGSVNVGSSVISTLVFSFSGGGYVGAPKVLTQGATGLDFIDAGSGTCTINGSTHHYSANDTCTVDVKFAPAAPGLRMGVVQLTDAGGNVVATAYVQGKGTGPEAVFNPGTVSTLGGGFNQPAGLAVDGRGNVFVADSFGNAVKEIPASCIAGANDASCVVTLGGGFSQPTGVAVDGAGNVYVADTNNNAVKEIPASCISGANSASCVVTLTTSITAPQKLTVDGSGYLYVSNFPVVGPIYKISPACASAGCVTALGGALSRPFGIQLDASGNVFVTSLDSKKIYKIPSTCMSASCVTTVTTFSQAPLNVAIDPGGGLYVLENPNRLLELPPGCTSERCATVLSSSLSGGDEVALDGNGNLYVADQVSNRVKKFSRTAPSLSFATATAVGSTDTTDGTETVTLQNIGNDTLTFPVPGTGFNPSVPNGFTYDSGSTCTQLDTSVTAPFTVASGASCTIGVKFQPAAVGSNSGNVVVTDNSLNVTNAMQHIGVSGTGIAPVPVVTGLSPTAGPQAGGTSVTITGSGFYGGGSSSDVTAVKFGGTAAAGYTVNSDTSITVPSPAGTGTVDVTVTTSVGTSATGSTDRFNYQAAQTITFTQPTTPVTFGATAVTLSATGGASGNAVVFTVDSGPGSISGTTLTITGAGTIVIDANQAGSTNYTAAAQVQRSIVVNKATPGITWSNPSDIVYGTQLSATQLNATATGVGGALTGSFAYTPVSGTTLNGGSSQTLSVLFTPSDTTDYTTATKNVSINVTLATQATLSVTGVPGTAQPSNATFTVGSSGGSGTGAVSFNATGSCSVSGTTVTITSGSGICSVTATKATDGNYSALTSAAATVNASLATQASLSVTGVPGTVQPFNTTFTVGSSGGSGSGAVSFNATGSCSVSGTTVTMTSGSGVCSVTATKAADSNYASATSSAATVNASLATQAALSVTGVPGPAQPFNATFTVGSSGGSGTGAVTFNATGSCSVSGTAVTIASGAGVCSVTATKAADSNYASATSSAATVNASLATQAALSVTGVPGATQPFNATFTVGSSGGSGTGAVTFTAVGSCSVSGTTATMTSGSGVCSITATKAADGNYAALTSSAATANASLATQAALSVTGVAGAMQPFNATFTVGSSGGSGTGVLSFNATGSCSVSGTTVTITSGSGTCSVTATKATDGNYAALTSSAATATASLATQAALSVTGVPGTAQPFNATFMVGTSGGSGTGAVTFNTTGSCSVSGTTVTMTSGSGVCSVTAAKAGDANYTSATSSAATVNASLATQAALTVTGVPGAAQPFNATFVVGSSGGSGTGAVTFNTTGSCAVSGTTVTITSGSGVCSVTATKAADSNYAALTSSAAAVNASLAAQAISFTQPATPVNFGMSPVALSATGGASGNTVTFNVASGPGSVSGTTLQITGAGTIVISANQAGNSNYAAATQVQRSIVVNKAAPTVGWAQPGAIGYGTTLATVLNAAASYNSNSVAGTYTYTATPSAGSAVTVTASTVLAVGSYTLNVAFTPTDTDDYTTATGSVTLAVGQGQPVIGWSPQPAIVYGMTLGSVLNAAASYNANSVAGTYAYTATPSGGSAGAVTANTVLGAGSYTLNVAFTPTDTTTYKTATAGLTLTVNRATPAVSLTSSVNPLLVQNTTQLTATVSSTASVPTGTVTFLDGTNSLASVALTAGVATLNVNTLTVSTHSITAVYAGDTNFVTATSTAVSQQVQDFNLAIGGGAQTSATVLPGGAAVYTFTLSPTGSTTFPAAIALSVTGLPAGATATLNPSTITSGAGTTTVTLTVQTASQTAAVHGLGRLAPVTLGLLLLPFAGRMRRSAGRTKRLLAVLVLLVAGGVATVGMTGCGSQVGFFGNAPQSYTLTITGTSGALSHSANVTLTIQ